MRLSSATTVPTRFAYNSDAQTVILMPINPLSGQTQYTVNVTNRVKDKVGKVFTNTSWSFTTEKAAAVETPAVRKGTASKPLVLLNGQYVNFTDANPYIKNGSTLIPIRALCDALGAQTTWEQSSQKITILLNGNKVVLQIGNKTGYQNGTPITLEAPAEITNSRTMVPLSMVAQGLGVKVAWNAVNYTVEMTK